LHSLPRHRLWRLEEFEAVPVWIDEIAHVAAGVGTHRDHHRLAPEQYASTAEAPVLGLDVVDEQRQVCESDIAGRGLRAGADRLDVFDELKRRCGSPRRRKNRNVEYRMWHSDELASVGVVLALATEKRESELVDVPVSSSVDVRP